MEQGKGQLQSVQSFQLTTNNTTDREIRKRLKIFYYKEIEIQLHSNLGRASRHRLPNWRDSGFRATGLFSCDKNIFRPHDFPLASEDTEAAPVNHPALVKTSDQPSFNSANFSPFTSAEALRASGISAD